jgi:hypothetical protein
MSIKGVLWRFALAYLAVVIAAGIALNYFGVEGGSWVNIAALAACVSWVCTAFGKANGRYFTSSEKTAAVIGLLAIDLVLQFVVTFAVALSRGPSQANSGALVFALVFVGALHAVAIYFFVGMTGKSLAKQGVISG